MTKNKGASQELSPEELMKTLYWWGVPTLFRCPHDPNPAHCDIALVGVPHSSGNGATERDQHLGPRAVRHVSANHRRMHNQFGIDPWSLARIHDVGDVPLPEAMANELCMERIAVFFDELAAAGTRAVSIGGDHSITGGIVRGLAGKRSKLTKGSKVALLQLDAHTDCYESLEHWLGNKSSAAHWASYLVHQGYVDAHKSVQIGIRGNTYTLDTLEIPRRLGYEVIGMDRYEELGPDKCIRIIKERVGESPIYVTFDLDCLDPTVAPAVAAPVAGEEGFGINEAVRLVRSLRGLDIIGGDVVCLMPTKDSTNNITSMVACAIMFEMIAMIGERIGGTYCPQSEVTES